MRKLIDLFIRWWIKKFDLNRWQNIFCRIDFCEVGRIGLGSEFIDRYIAKRNDWNELSEKEKRIFHKDIQQLKRERRDYTRYLSICLA